MTVKRAQAQKRDKTAFAPLSVVRRVRLWQRRMGLTGWSVAVLMPEICRVKGERVKAFTVWEPNYQHGRIYIDAATYRAMSTAERDHLICHELHHLIEARETDAIVRYVGDQGEVYRVWNDANEAAADHIASLIVSLYTKPKRKK